MNYSRFEEFRVWQEAIRLADGVCDIAEGRNWCGSQSLRNQLERAALSISNNIAEWFERRTTKGLLAFLYFARGSAGEVGSMLCFIERCQGFAKLKSHISDLKSTAESCSRQLRAWADHLQNTDIRGQRHLTEEARKHYHTKQKAAAFQEELKAQLPPDHPLRRVRPWHNLL